MTNSQFDTLISKMEVQNAKMETHNSQTAAIAAKQNGYAVDLKTLNMNISTLANKISGSNNMFWLGLVSIIATLVVVFVK